MRWMRALEWKPGGRCDNAVRRWGLFDMTRYTSLPLTAITGGVPRWGDPVRLRPAQDARVLKASTGAYGNSHRPFFRRGRKWQGWQSRPSSAIGVDRFAVSLLLDDLVYGRG